MSVTSGATAFSSPSPQVPGFLRLLAHDVRWRLMLALARSDHRVHELIALLDQPANLVSYHLKKLREGELVHERRSSADARDIYYSIDLGKVRDMFFAAGDALHPGITHAQVESAHGSEPTTPRGLAPGSSQPARSRSERAERAERVEAAERAGGVDGPQKARVLFLCTHNSARSQMAEGILRQIGGNLVEVCSAGTEPSQVHADAIRTLAGMGIDITGHHSKHVDEFRDQRFDYVVTVCDKARESCPYFAGDPDQIHWSFPDPSALEDEEARLQLFRSIAHDLLARNRFLLSLVEGDRRRSKGQ